MKSPSSGESSTNLSDPKYQFYSRIEEVHGDIDWIFLVSTENFPPGEAVYVLSGGRCSFKTTLLAAGDRATIKIKPDYRDATLLLSRSGASKHLRHHFGAPPFYRKEDPHHPLRTPQDTPKDTQ